MGLKVFLSEGLSLRATLGVFLANTRDVTPNDGGGSLTLGRNGKLRRRVGGGRGLFGVMTKDVLLSSFKYSALVDETPPLLSPLCCMGQPLLHRAVLQPLEFGSLA